MNAFMSKYGWKTLLGTVLLAAGQVLRLWPETEQYAAPVEVVGTLLGGIGIRSAIARSGN